MTWWPLMQALALHILPQCAALYWLAQAGSPAPAQGRIDRLLKALMVVGIQVIVAVMVPATVVPWYVSWIFLSAGLLLAARTGWQVRNRRWFAPGGWGSRTRRGALALAAAAAVGGAGYLDRNRLVRR